MPIALKDYSWHQNLTSVLLKVNTGNVRPSTTNCAVTIASRYLKLSLPPYIFELFLAEKTQFGDAKVTFGNNHVALTLPKFEEGREWMAIESADLTKEQKQQLRRDAELEQLEWYKKRDTDIQEKNKDLCKKNVEHQLKQMEENRQRIERVKKEIVRQALEDTLQWKQTLPDDYKNNNKASGKLNKTSSSESQRKADVAQAVEKVEEEETEPEEPIELYVSFTPRIFPTPKRESHKPMEQKWEKQREDAMRVVGVSPEEAENSDPGWMYNKARELVETGKYHGAAALASHALSKCPLHSGLRLVLSVAYLHLGHWYQAIECSTRGLESSSLDDEVRPKLVAVRGVALSRSGREKEGKMEIKLSLAKLKMDSLLDTLASDFKLD